MLPEATYGNAPCCKTSLEAAVSRISRVITEQTSNFSLLSIETISIKFTALWLQSRLPVCCTPVTDRAELSLMQLVVGTMLINQATSSHVDMVCIILPHTEWEHVVRAVLLWYAANAGSLVCNWQLWLKQVNILLTPQKATFCGWNGPFIKRFEIVWRAWGSWGT